MKVIIKSLLALPLLLSFGHSNTIIDASNAIFHGQDYCTETQPKTSIDYLKSVSKYAYNVCRDDFADNPTNQKDFEVLKKLYKENPAKYGLYIANAYVLDFKNPNGNEGFEQDVLNAFKVSANAGNTNAKLWYCFAEVGFKLTRDLSAKMSAVPCLEKIKSPKANMAIALLYQPLDDNYCHYMEKATKSGYLDAYPFSLNCELNGKNKRKMTDQEKEKLQSVITNPSTQLASKYLASVMLGDTKKAELLGALGGLN